MQYEVMKVNDLTPSANIGCINGCSNGFCPYFICPPTDILCWSPDILTCATNPVCDHPLLTTCRPPGGGGGSTHACYIVDPTGA